MKKLIYFTLGNNLDYLQLTKLHIESLNKQNYDGDILFITNLKKEILSSIKFIKEPLFLEVNNTNLLESSANKLKIHQYQDIKLYDKIIFCDLDTLWVKNPNLIFNEIIENQFYVTNETPLMSKDLWWGGAFFSQEEKNDIQLNDIKGINAGFFAFNSSMVDYFKDMENFFLENKDKSNHCLEQPFFNVFLYRNKIYNTKLNNLVAHDGCRISSYNGVLVHFAGGPGQANNKFLNMQNFYEKNIK